MKRLSMQLWLTCTALCLAMACGDGGSEEETSSGWDVQDEQFSSHKEKEDEEEPDDPPEPDPEPEPEPEPEGLPDGSACAQDADCEGGLCLTGDGYPDGYCARPSCPEDGCGEDARCVDNDLGTFCAPSCSNDDECREGYACAEEATTAGKVCAPARGLADGSPCAADADCQGGTCIVEWHEGYCTTLGCSTFEDCARQGHENKCLRNPRGPNLCVRMCTSNEDCRDGYVCERLGGGEGMCAPDPATPIDPAALENNPFELVCSDATAGQVVLDFEIAPETSAYMITPFTRDGRDITPMHIARPSGATIDLQGTNQFQAIPAYLYGGMNPTIVPATAQMADQLEAGSHQYTLDTEAEQMCYYLLEEEQPGNTIDFNVYLVGVPGIDAASAPTHPDMQVVFEEFDRIYGQAGYVSGEVRFFDISGDDADRFAVLRSDDAVADLVSLSERPGDTMEDVLSINVFFVRAFAMGGAIGISLGLPGPAGLHGTHGSGVAFTSEYMGQDVPNGQGATVDGNIITAQVLAHEVGHYLGLFHTSEQSGYMHDPLPDTPECQQISRNCPDIDNLMFPFAGVSHTQISADQGFVLGVNPLTRYVEAPADEGTDTDTSDSRAGGN